MARLLVSVRSASEARAAVEGGAAIVDVKEPSRGSLGRASVDVWREVRAAIPDSTILSVALGELVEWSTGDLPREGWEGIRHRKIGLAGSGEHWRERWSDLRARFETGPGWVAVAYLDWRTAGAPDPVAVIDEAATIADCAGVLFDTFDKSRPIEVPDREWRDRIDRVRAFGRFVAIAGSLDEERIRRLRSMEPDLFAVRGAACEGGDRIRAIDPDRVARLVRAAGADDVPIRNPDRTGRPGPVAGLGRG